MPYARNRSSMPLSFDSSPVASMVRLERPTSTILARNTLAISMISLRRSGAALTLNSASSRSMADVSVRSVILNTLTSLLSCLVSCSYASSSAFTMMVMRDMVGSSVGPTDSESMLKPRRETMPVTRESTPGLFSTKTDRMCFIGTPLPRPRPRAARPRAVLCLRDRFPIGRRTEHRS